MNPENIVLDEDTGYFPPEVNARVPGMLRTIALIWVVQLAVVLFLTSTYTPHDEAHHNQIQRL